MHFRSVACRAFWTAAGDGRPGPVHLNLSWRDPLGPEPRPDDLVATSALALEGREGRPLTTVPRPPAAAPPALVEALADQLDAHPHGVIVAGRMPPGDAEAIAALARTAGYPILAEPTSQLRFGDHDRALVIGAYEPIARARPAALAPTLILRFGEMPTCKPLRAWLAQLGEAAQIVVDPQGDWNEPSRIAGAMVRAAPSALAPALAEALSRAPDGSWAERWLAASAAVDAAIDAELDGVTEPTEPGLQRALGHLYDDGDLVYTASSMPIRDQEAFLGSGDAEVVFLANRGANGIDGLISSGIGAAIATGRPTWIVTGDLGLFHDMNALATLRHATTPVRIVVIDNDGGGIFNFLPQAEQLAPEEFEALLGTPLGLEAQRIAALYEIPYIRIENLGELAATTGTALIEVRTERAANLALHRRLTQATARALEQTFG
jgi:2-succinyl-5-enolpyruvyl-6-hydroxy-3-cyclohexene-1-carboxylate synthase